MNAWITGESILTYQRVSLWGWSPVPCTTCLEDRELSSSDDLLGKRNCPSSLPWPLPAAFHTPLPRHRSSEVSCLLLTLERGPWLPGPTPVPLPPLPFPPQQDSHAHASAELAGSLKHQHKFQSVLAHFGLWSTTGIIQTENYSSNNLLPTALSALTSQRCKQLKTYLMMGQGKSGIHSICFYGLFNSFYCGRDGQNQSYARIGLGCNLGSYILTV